MNWARISAHEQGLVSLLGFGHFFIMIIYGIFHIEDKYFWITILLTTLGSIILELQDQEASIDQIPSVYSQAVRLTTDVTFIVISSLLPALICNFNDNNVGFFEILNGKPVHLVCHYATLGKIIVTFSVSLFISSVCRAVVSGIHLLYKAFALLWEHADDED